MASLCSCISMTMAFLVLLISQVDSLTCTSQMLSSKKVYSNCTDLPTLSAYLHWTYDESNSSLSIAFSAKSVGWASWAINPTGTGMAGAQALVAYSSKGTITFKTFNITSYSSIVPSKLSFEVWDSSAEASNGTIRIFATVKVPAKTTTLNHIWQVGPGVNETTGFIIKHEFKPENLNSKGVLELAGNSTTPTADDNAPAPTPTSSSQKGAGSGIKSDTDLSFYALFLFLGTLVIFRV